LESSGIVFVLVGGTFVNAPFLEFGGVWIALVGEIWKHRNIRVFKDGRVDYLEAFVVVQRKT